MVYIYSNIYLTERQELTQELALRKQRKNYIKKYRLDYILPAHNPNQELWYNTLNRLKRERRQFEHWQSTQWLEAYYEVASQPEAEPPCADKFNNI